MLRTWAQEKRFKVYKRTSSNYRLKDPIVGIFLNPQKSIMIVKEQNREVAKIYFKDLGFTIITGSRYFRGFIGEEPNQQAWIQELAASWVAAKKELSMVGEKCPQAAYAGDCKTHCNRNGSSSNVLRSTSVRNFTTSKRHSKRYSCQPSPAMTSHTTSQDALKLDLLF
jgi:hypothetical protein